MLLKAREPRIKLTKPIGMQGPVMVIDEGNHVQLHHVGMPQMLALLNDPLHGDLVGVPVYYAMNLPENELLVYPAPRQDMKCEFYFYPPMDKQ